MRNPATRSRLAALLISFVVYLLPILGPHATLPLGMLLAKAARDGAELGWPWLAASFGVALLLQAALGLAVYWFLQRRSWVRGLAVGGAGLLCLLVTQVAYLLVIPAVSLVEVEWRPELITWPQECEIAGAALAATRSSPHLLVEQAGEALLVRASDSRYLLLKLPGCATRELDLQFSNLGSGAAFVLPGGTMFYNRWGKAVGESTWWYVRAAGEPPQRIEPPPGYTLEGNLPVLSDDGQWAAWLTRPDANNRASARVVLRHITSGAEKYFALPAEPRGWDGVVAADAAADRIVVSRNLYEFFEVNQGQPPVAVGPLPAQGAVKPHPGNLLLPAGGWVAWDGYQDRESYRLAWSLPKGRGAHRVPRGRLIQSVAVDPHGRFVALSTGEALNLGLIRDAVYVLRADNGQEVFRRYFPKYNRSEVRFLTGEFFAYSDGPTVRVLRLPPGDR